MVSTNGYGIYGLKSKKSFSEKIIKENNLNAEFFKKSQVQEAIVVNPFKSTKSTRFSNLESDEFNPRFYNN